MSDCQSIEIRDRLPDYDLGDLESSVRQAIASHLAGCEECRGELAMLRAVRDAHIRTTPTVDVATIVRALPRPRAVRRVPRQWLLRLAAAVSFVTVGAISVAVVRSFYAPPPGLETDSARVVASVDSQALRAMAGAAASGARAGLTVGGGVSDLGADELEQLIGALDGIEAAPSAEPEEFTPVSLSYSGASRRE